MLNDSNHKKVMQSSKPLLMMAKTRHIPIPKKRVINNNNHLYPKKNNNHQSQKRKNKSKNYHANQR